MPSALLAGLYVSCGSNACLHSRNCVQVHAVNASYPGRASMSPGLDLLITLLHWGEAGVAHVQSWVSCVSVHAVFDSDKRMQAGGRYCRKERNCYRLLKRGWKRSLHLTVRPNALFIDETSSVVDPA